MSIARIPVFSGNGKVTKIRYFGERACTGYERIPDCASHCVNISSSAPINSAVIPLSLPVVQAPAILEKSEEVTGKPFKEPPKEAPKEAQKVESKPGGLEDSTSFILDILRSHRQESIPRDTIQNVLRALGYAILNVDSILAKLKSAGEIIKPRDGFFRAV